MLSIFLYPFLTVLCLFFLGTGLTLFLAPPSIKKYQFWIAPWFAIIFLIFILVFLNLLGVSIKYSSYFIAFALSVLTIYALLKSKRKFYFDIKTDLIVMFAVITNILFNLVSLFKYEKILTSVSLGNQDIVNYAFSVDLIKNNLIYTEPLLGVVSVNDMFHNLFRWGPSIFLSFFTSIFNLQGYQYVYIAQVVLFALTIPLIYILFKILFRSTIASLIFILTITAFNANLLYIIYHNFFGQVLFWGLELFIIIFFLFYLNSHEAKVNKLSLYDLILGVTLGVLFISYNEGTVFIVLPLAVYGIVNFLFYKNLNNLISLVRIFIIAFFTSSINIIYTIINLFSRFTYKSIGNEAIGWPPFRSSIPFPNPYEILGFYNIHKFEALQSIIAIFLSLLVIALIVYGLSKIKQRLFISCFIFFYIFLYYWTGISRHNYFDYYKVATYTLFLFSILFTVGLFTILSRKKKILYIFISTLVVLELYSAISLNKHMNQLRLVVDKGLISLEALNEQYKTKEKIYSPSSLTNEESSWESLWREYFLYPKTITYATTDQTSDSYTSGISDDSLVLMPKTSRLKNNPKVLVKKIEWENKHYKLGRLCDSDACLSNTNKDLSSVQIGKSLYEDTIFAKGWSVLELDHRWANSLYSTLRLVRHNQSYYLKIEARSLAKPQTLSVFMNEEFMGQANIDTEWNIYEFPINQSFAGLYRIKFVYSSIYSPIKIGISNDSRELTIDFKKIWLE
jgi:hypothetical protein